ncbi:MAG: 23S rRNA (adenine(2030)-N(6))-methyltransferase RlmJ [Phreatobacter sp.]|uniref:23S rRNA (adenine(2030)-N(6))-methyltransferase RlmJ n=1 Tax=Phreatobacter sp. TaxID=1966341 RepID=UPI0027346D34|nr:23S rRNA (adenine(2030)-N(6))-methyltransferase RlmJ [Phreatobacter sp.]MDP2801640.1 23S rRNA (adenine(2030)-N(6))-methyltransferase RlmJ [Phreatobacter sp.]
MNYRHAFHAGNPADVIKHAVFAFILAHMMQKDTPLRVVDTHAGTGRYDLTSDPAERTGEWVEGIGRLWGKDLPEPLAVFLDPYLDVVARLNPDGRLTHYPGSPEIARLMTRPIDGLTFCELHPEDSRTLASLFHAEKRAKVITLDGWLAPKAFLPPKEKRGLVLIDPPFERRGDYDRLAEALANGVRRFATGVFVLWYPVKDPLEVKRFHRMIADLAIPKCLTIEATWRVVDGQRLSGAGLVTVNAPYTLAPVIRAAGQLLWNALNVPAGRLLVSGDAS